MKPQLLRLLFILPALLVLAACHKDPKPEPELTPHRTVLIYMAANNSLGYYDYDELDLDEMKAAVEANALQGGRLMVYHAPYGGGAPTLIELTKNGEILHKTYSTDISTLSVERFHEVFADVITYAPAKDYGLVLWSHGTGWIEAGNSRSSSQPLSRLGEEVMPLSFGEDGRVKMDISDLAVALKPFSPSFIYFDACLMGNVETAYELRDVTPVIVASGTETTVYGMRYDYNLPVFFAPQLDLVKAAENTYNYYQSGDAPYKACTISVINTAPLAELAEATRNIMLTGALPAPDYRPISYRLYYDETYDMPDYIRNLDVDPALIAKWNEAYAKTVTYHASTPYYGSLDTSNYGGLGCYILRYPEDTSYKGYNKTSWFKDVVSLNPSLQP